MLKHRALRLDQSWAAWAASCIFVDERSSVCHRLKFRGLNRAKKKQRREIQNLLERRRKKNSETGSNKKLARDVPDIRPCLQLGSARPLASTHTMLNDVVFEDDHSSDGNDEDEFDAFSRAIRTPANASRDAAPCDKDLENLPSDLRNVGLSWKVHQNESMEIDEEDLKTIEACSKCFKPVPRARRKQQRCHGSTYCFVDEPGLCELTMTQRKLLFLLAHVRKQLFLVKKFVVGTSSLTPAEGRSKDAGLQQIYVHEEAAGDEEAGAGEEAEQHTTGSKYVCVDDMLRESTAQGPVLHET
jgi:hypothetical protein